MTHEQNIEGLEYLQWSMFDSPDSPGSGYRFMEREPVLILDKVVKSTRLNVKVELGYVTPRYADSIRLVSTDSHRIGQAIRIRCTQPTVRMKLVEWLLKHGAYNIAIGFKCIYFDQDRQKKRTLRLWDDVNVYPKNAEV